MTTVLPMAACLVAGAAAGALAVFVKLRPQLGAQTAEIRELQRQLQANATAAQQLADLQAQTATLRHDLRGILSPALLSADRLSNSQDPAIRKVGDIVIRTVERATARMAETKTPQGSPKMPTA